MIGKPGALLPARVAPEEGFRVNGLRVQDESVARVRVERVGDSLRQLGASGVEDKAARGARVDQAGSVEFAGRALGNYLG